MMLLWETDHQRGSARLRLALDSGTLSPLLKRLPPRAWSPATAGSRTSARSPSRSPIRAAALQDKAFRISEEMIGAIGFDTDEFDELKAACACSSIASTTAKPSAPEAPTRHLRPYADRETPWPSAPPAPPGTAPCRTAPPDRTGQLRPGHVRRLLAEADLRLGRRQHQPGGADRRGARVLYAMAFSGGIAKAGGTPQSLDVTADVNFGPDTERGGFMITGIKLTVRGQVEGLDAAGSRRPRRRPRPAARSARRSPASTSRWTPLSRSERTTARPRGGTGRRSAVTAGGRRTSSASRASRAVEAGEELAEPDDVVLRPVVHVLLPAGARARRGCARAARPPATDAVSTWARPSSGSGAGSTSPRSTRVATWRLTCSCPGRGG